MTEILGGTAVAMLAGILFVAGELVGGAVTACCAIIIAGSRNCEGDAE